MGVHICIVPSLSGVSTHVTYSSAIVTLIYTIFRLLLSAKHTWRISSGDSDVVSQSVR